MVMKTELERIDGRRRKRGRPQRPSTVSNRFILTLDYFWFCIFRITYSSPLFPFPSTGGHHTSALAAPVVLTAPDRAVLMGADDDWRPWGELTAHKGHISPHRCRGRDGESERKEEEWRQVDERREGGKKNPWEGARMKTDSRTERCEMSKSCRNHSEGGQGEERLN